MREILIEAKSRLQTEKLELGKDVYICVAISNTKTFNQDEKREAVELVQSKLKEQMPHTTGSVFTREHVAKTLYGNVDYCPISKADAQRARHMWLNRLIEELVK